MPFNLAEAHALGMITLAPPQLKIRKWTERPANIHHATDKLSDFPGAEITDDADDLSR